MKKVALNPGDTLPARPEIEGFTIERLTDEEKAKLGIKMDYAVCSTGGADNGHRILAILLL